MIYKLCVSLVLLPLISLLTALPLTNINEHQLVDESNNKLILSNSSSVILNTQEKENNGALANTDDNPASLAKATNSAEGSTSGSPYTIRSTSDDDTPWYVYFLVAIFILCCCCGSGSGAYRAKTGRWVPARVWVED